MEPGICRVNLSIPSPAQITNYERLLIPEPVTHIGTSALVTRPRQAVAVMPEIAGSRTPTAGLGSVVGRDNAWPRRDRAGRRPDNGRACSDCRFSCGENAQAPSVLGAARNLVEESAGGATCPSTGPARRETVTRFCLPCASAQPCSRSAQTPARRSGSCGTSNQVGHPGPG